MTEIDAVVYAWGGKLFAIFDIIARLYVISRLLYKIVLSLLSNDVVQPKDGLFEG